MQNSKFRYLVIGVVGIIVVFATLLFLLVKRGEPFRKGRFVTDKVEHRIEIAFDKYGIPYIKAFSWHDAYFALGFLHANDRIFQMDMGRRLAEGRLSEIAGEKTVKQDILMRRLFLKSLASSIVSRLSKESLEIVQAYTDGVNFWLELNKNNLPPEYFLLKVKPEKWRPVDSIYFYLLMVKDLTWSEFYSEVRNLRLIELKERDFALVDGRDTYTTYQLASFLKQNKLSRYRFDEDISNRGASNNWVYSNNNVVSIANDPHLDLKLPPVWYLAVIQVENRKIQGATIPGLPGVVIGATDCLSWALTSTMQDEIDLFVEKWNGEDKVLRDKEWFPLEVTEETIKVKNADPITVKVYKSDIGPFFPPTGLNPPFSMEWLVYYADDFILPLSKLASTCEIEEVISYIDSFFSPAQNLVVALKNGVIAHIFLGRMPKRKGSGNIPLPAWIKGFAGWSGIYPFSYNKMIFKEKSYIVTANHDWRTEEDSWEGVFYPPSRYVRIENLIKNIEKEEDILSYFSEIQTDNVSPFAVKIIDFVKSNLSLDRYPEIKETLEQFDGSIKGKKGLVYTVLLDELLAAVFEDELEAANVKADYLTKERWFFNILNSCSDGGWFDNLRSDKIETLKDILEIVLKRARQRLWNFYGPPHSWNYEEVNWLLLRHPLSSVPLIGTFLVRGPYGVTGTGNAPIAFSVKEWRKDRRLVNHGPSLRFGFDLVEQKGYFVIPGGQSGHPFHKNYDDQLKLYLEGESVPILTFDDVRKSSSQLIIIDNLD